VGSSSISFSGAPTSTAPSSGISTPSFTGLSGYSADLQNALNRSVALASLPLQQLQNEQSTLTSQSTELNTLSTLFSSLQASITNLNSSSQQLLTASVSDTSVLNAQVGAGALAGTYSVQVTDPGSSASAMGSNGLTVVSDPTTESVSSASTFTLTVGSTRYTITPAGNNLNALATAINSQSSGSVQASVVNVGPPSAPDYRLSVQGTAIGDLPIQLSFQAGLVTTDLLTPLATGTLAQYQVNGQPAKPISSPTNTVTLAPGVTLNLLKVGTTTVTVAPGTSSITNALTSFTSAFNAAVDELNKNIGQGTGPLAGQSVVYSLQQALNNLGSYTAAGNGATSLADLGVTFDSTGHLNFDSSVLAGASGTQISNVAAFLGSGINGGFLQFATNQLTAIEDPTTGILPNTISSTTTSINNDNTQISQQQDRINQLQTSLQAQMAKADAAIAQLEQQQTYYTSLFTAMILPSPQQLGSL
jgi:flagellar hook-associated protein 2